MLRAAGHSAVPSSRRSRETAGTYLGDGGGFGPDGDSSSEECAKHSARVHLARHVPLPCQTGRGRVCEVLKVDVSGARKPLFLGRPRRSQLRIVVEERIGPRPGKALESLNRRFDHERRREADDARRVVDENVFSAWPRPARGTPARARSRHARVRLRAPFPLPAAVAATRAAGEPRAPSPRVALGASRVGAVRVGVDVRNRRRATGWLRVQRRRDDLPVPLRRLGGPE